MACTASNSVLACQARSDSTYVTANISAFLGASVALSIAAYRLGSSNNVAPNTTTAVSGDIVSVQPTHGQNMV